MHSSLGGLRHLHCITEVSLIGYFDAGEIWWTVELLTSQVDGKIDLGFQHLQDDLHCLCQCLFIWSSLLDRGDD